MSAEFNDDDLPLHARLAERLHQLGWRDACDAQHSNLRNALPELRAMLAPHVDDGGPAFPVNDSQRAHEVAAAAEDACDPMLSAAERERAYIVARGRAIGGMTLRDYLAAHALPGVLTTSWPDLNFKPINGLSTIENTALLAYQVADAMLKVRAAS